MGIQRPRMSMERDDAIQKGSISKNMNPFLLYTMSFSQTRLVAGISSTVTTTIIAIATITTRRAVVMASCFAWTRFIDNYFTSFKILTIQFIDSFLSFVSIWHFDKAKTTR